MPALSSYPNFGRIRQGDMNMDGFPDLFVTFLVGKKSGNELQSFVLFNNPCTETQCSKEASSRVSYGIAMPRRYFEIQ